MLRKLNARICFDREFTDDFEGLWNSKGHVYTTVAYTPNYNKSTSEISFQTF